MAIANMKGACITPYQHRHMIYAVHCSSITIFLEILLYQLLLRSYVLPLMIICYGIPLFYGVIR